MNPKITYLFHYAPMPGVIKKICQKINTLRKFNVPIELLVTYKNDCPKDDFKSLDDCQFLKIEEYKVKKIHSNRWLNGVSEKNKQKHFYSQLTNYFRKNKSDLIITRYGNVNEYSFKFQESVGHKIIYELNTIQSVQNIVNWNYKENNSNPKWIEFIVESEKKFVSPSLSMAIANISVTEEIKNHYQELTRSQKPNFIISNGIDCSTVEVLKSTSTDKINLLMILGVNAYWNGLDVIAEALKSREDVVLHVVGDVTMKTNFDNILFHGKKKSDEIEDLIQKHNIHIGVGSLAIERKGISEASPLKVREYLSRGLPVILNYYDTDLENDQDFLNQFCLKFSGDLNLDELLERFKTIRSIDGYNQKIREWAEQNISFDVKMKLYKDVINFALETDF